MIYDLDERRPQVHDSCFVAPNAAVIGSVTLEEQASIWFNVTLRGDCEEIHVGRGSNIQDGAVVHADPGFPCRIGEHVTIGHLAMVHGCTIGEGSLIGINAVVLNGAVIGKGCLVGANALVKEGMVVPDGAMVLGSPAKVVRQFTPEQQEAIRASALNYVSNGQRFRKHLKLRDI